MSAAVLPWPTHRRCAQMTADIFRHVRDTLPADGGRDWIALMAALAYIIETEPTFARRLDAEFKRMQRSV